MRPLARMSGSGVSAIVGFSMTFRRVPFAFVYKMQYFPFECKYQQGLSCNLGHRVIGRIATFAHGSSAAPWLHIQISFRIIVTMTTLREGLTAMQRFSRPVTNPKCEVFRASHDHAHPLCTAATAGRQRRGWIRQRAPLSRQDEIVVTRSWLTEPISTAVPIDPHPSLANEGVSKPPAFKSHNHTSWYCEQPSLSIMWQDERV